MRIDLRSDTVTQPSEGMLKAMFSAKTGDDVFGEDATINALQSRVAELFGHEAGLFCPSGTMTNQIAIRVHARPGDEVICANVAHVYLYEGGGIARNAGASVRLLSGDRGRLSAKEVEAAINGDDAHLPKTSLICLEDTVNKGGGCCYDLKEIKAISSLAKKKGLGLHLDGARLFNALTVTGYDYADYGKQFDSISICFSKGLGCPVGSVLVGSRDFIREAHRVRKGFGGGMRQAGILAAACGYALDHHIHRLSDDHARAKQLATSLSKSSIALDVMPVETNIVIFGVEASTSSKVVERLAQESLIAVPFGPDHVRFVTHLDFSDHQLQESCKIIEALEL
jgi:threonine aldolase